MAQPPTRCMLMLTILKVIHGKDLPELFLKYAYNKKENISLLSAGARCWFGPDGSFLISDGYIIRWSKLPESLEEAVQSLLSPKGWISGPPSIMAWNTDGAYCVVSNSGTTWKCHIPRQCHSLTKAWEAQEMSQMLSENKVQVSEAANQKKCMAGAQTANASSRPFRSTYPTRITTFSQLQNTHTATTCPKTLKLSATLSMHRLQNPFAGRVQKSVPRRSCAVNSAKSQSSRQISKRKSGKPSWRSTTTCGGRK